ncbi:MAG TPA: hypothetical protein VH109_12450, partial [Steroidobacteraceae bacterium]|nr:hypothetical protein [Steroidobacteraceae bacterium]
DDSRVRHGSADTQTGQDRRLVPPRQSRERRTIEIIVVIVTEQDGIDTRQIAQGECRSAHALMPRRALDRCAGEQTGSVSRLSPALCKSTVLCPTRVARTEPSSTFGVGISPSRVGTCRGQGFGRRRASQRSTSAGRCGGRPLRL